MTAKEMMKRQADLERIDKMREIAELRKQSEELRNEREPVKIYSQW